ncbi:hypothetical protein GQ600_22177 [Phytophthora cactorum]|nr:hypothetical protein GQ600_22177 [Phytophthora cactorum]
MDNNFQHRRHHTEYTPWRCPTSKCLWHNSKQRYTGQDNSYLQDTHGKRDRPDQKQQQLVITTMTTRSHRYALPPNCSFQAGTEPVTGSHRHNCVQQDMYGTSPLLRCCYGHECPLGHVVQVKLSTREYEPLEHATGPIVGSEHAYPAGHVSHGVAPEFME